MPPTPLEVEILREAIREITDDDIVRFATLTMTDKRPTDKKGRQLNMRTVMKFATLGWQCLAVYKVRDHVISERVARATGAGRRRTATKKKTVGSRRKAGTRRGKTSKTTGGSK